jgi:hypothetical protein
MFSQGSRYPDNLGVSQLLLTPWSKVLPEQLGVPQLVEKFPQFMEPEVSLPHLQVLTTCP